MEGMLPQVGTEVWEEQAHVRMNELGRGIPAIEELVGKRLIWLE